MTSPEPVSQKQQQALRDLDALRRERDLFDGWLHGFFTRGFSHFSARDADGTDPMEIWGMRIGRALGAVAFIALCVYLYGTYAR